MSSPVTFEALLDCQSPSMVELSPDGGQIAFVVSPGAEPKDALARNQLWVGSPSGDVAPVPGAEIAALPRWSHDGQRLAFAADPEGRGLLSLHLREPSGEVRALGALEGTVQAIRWSADDSRLLVLAADPGLEDTGMSNWQRIEPPGGWPNPTVTRPRDLYRRLFFIDAETGATQEVGPVDLNIWDFDWTGSGEAVAIVSQGSGESASYSASLALLDLDARGCRIVYEPEWQIQEPAISPDGRIAFVEGWCSDRNSGGGSPRLLDTDAGQARVISAELHDQYHVQRLRWLADGSLFYVGQAGVETMCGRLEPSGEISWIWKGPATLGETHTQQASISDDGRIVAARKEAPGEPPEVMVLDAADPEADWKAITTFNQGLLGLSVPQCERVAWQSEEGEIEGILLTPHDRGDARLPLVVFAHGGPCTAWTMNYSLGYQHMGIPLAHRGYAVLLPNHRGSAGRGQDFVRANHGRHGPVQLADFEAGVESLHEAGIVDRERAGIFGISDGGYQSAYAATCSRVFKAAIPESCVSDWVSFHLTSSAGGFERPLLQSDPRDPEGNYLKLSPVMHAGEARIPTLILHGSLDLICPLGQAEELYRALVNANVETELVVYEDGHVLVKREHLLDMWERVTTWFDRHLAAP